MKSLRTGAVARAALLFVIVLMTACTRAEQAEPGREIEIDESHNGQQVELAPGEMLVIRLTSNPTTGYEWAIAELDARLLQQIGGRGFESSAPDDPAPPPGTGGWAIYRFRAISAGEAALKLIYHQPWTEQESIGVYAVRVVVR